MNIITVAIPSIYHNVITAIHTVGCGYADSLITVEPPWHNYGRHYWGTFGRYREVVFVRSLIAHHTYDSIPAANEFKSFT